MRQLKKSRRGVLKGKWVPHDTRDEVVDYVRRWTSRTELPAKRVVGWIGVGMSKFHEWTKRYGKVNEHHALVPRDHWLEPWERQTILSFYGEHPQEGYRRLTYMLMDADLVAASPATVYRVLKSAGCFQRWNRKESHQGKGFQQPLAPHEHWHIDISYINVCGTFYYLTSVLDGCSRFIVHGELRESMKEADVEVVLQRAREQFPGARPRIISDNGPQFIAKDFKEFIRLCGMTHVRTSPYYPQSNGKLERWHGTLKQDCIRPGVPLSLEEARRLVAEFVEHYNRRRLHSAIGYIAPADKLAGREQTIFEQRDRKLEAARARRAEARRRAAHCPTDNDTLKQPAAWAEDKALLRSNLSADPGAEIGERGGFNAASTPLRDRRPCDKPSWHDATTTNAGGLPHSLTPCKKNSSSR
jgi:transposase InsO family protein